MLFYISSWFLQGDSLGKMNVANNKEFMQKNV